MSLFDGGFFQSGYYIMSFIIQYVANDSRYEDSFYNDGDEAGFVNIQSNKDVDIYQGNVQITRSFSPPTHVPLFDPREKKGISIHHQLGTEGYYIKGSTAVDNIDGVGSIFNREKELFSRSRYYFGDPDTNLDMLEMQNAPRLYIGVRRTGSPKWFYVSAKVTTKRIIDLYKIGVSRSRLQAKTEVFVSGSTEPPDYDPLVIKGQVVPISGELNFIYGEYVTNRLLQIHVYYVDNDNYMLFVSNEHLAAMPYEYNPNFPFGSPEYLNNKIWGVIKSDGTH
jgi:hypothetical protein